MTCGRKIGDFDCCAITQGDSRELIQQVPPGYITLCLTDPPYGIDLDYDIYKDSDSNLNELIDRTVQPMISVSNVTLITCGIRNMHRYPKPNWALCWYYKSGQYRSPWGFNCWQPVLCYGKDQFLKNGLGARSDVIETIESAVTFTTHPCPKPVKFWKELIRRGMAVIDPKQQSRIQRVFDPFMGSGTTAIAAKELGLHWFGFELSPDYVRQANERLNQEQLPFMQQTEEE